MMTTTTSVNLEDVVLEVVRQKHDPLVGALLTEAARTADVDIEVVASTMWDLVEKQRLSYGADAHVRLAPAG